jgi:hypothetical protein
LLLPGCATSLYDSGQPQSPMPDRRTTPRVAATPAAQDTARTSTPAWSGTAEPVAGSDEVPVPVPTPVPEQIVGSTASGGRITARAVAEIDSGPSPEAREVLATIPEPIAAGERVPPPERIQQQYPPIDATPGRGNPMAGVTGVAGAMRDSASADTVAVPTPEPTLPLGQRRTGTVPVIPDSVMRAIAEAARIDSIRRATGELPPAAAPPASTPGAGTAPAGAAGVAPADTCWRVQVSAPEEAERAEQMRGAAESLLLVPMVIEQEQGLYKVRTRDCMTGETATRLRGRAAPLFEGAFRFVRKP